MVEFTYLGLAPAKGSGPIKVGAVAYEVQQDLKRKQVKAFSSGTADLGAIKRRGSAGRALDPITVAFEGNHLVLTERVEPSNITNGIFELKRIREQHVLPSELDHEGTVVAFVYTQKKKCFVHCIGCSDQNSGNKLVESLGVRIKQLGRRMPSRGKTEPSETRFKRGQDEQASLRVRKAGSALDRRSHTYGESFSHFGTEGPAVIGTMSSFDIGSRRHSEVSTDGLDISQFLSTHNQNSTDTGENAGEKYGNSGTVEELDDVDSEVDEVEFAGYGFGDEDSGDEEWIPAPQPSPTRLVADDEDGYAVPVSLSSSQINRVPPTRYSGTSPMKAAARRESVHEYEYQAITLESAAGFDIPSTTQSVNAAKPELVSGDAMAVNAVGLLLKRTTLTSAKAGAKQKESNWQDIKAAGDREDLAAARTRELEIKDYDPALQKKQKESFRKGDVAPAEMHTAASRTAVRKADFQYEINPAEATRRTEEIEFRFGWGE